MRVRPHPPATRLVEPPEGQCNRTLVGIRAPFNHGPIGLAHLAVLEQKPQVSKRLAMAPEHKASGGVLVEAMRQGGRTRQAEPQGVEMILQAGAAFRSAMHREPGRLVDDQHQSIAIKHASQHLVRTNLFKWHEETGITAIDMKVPSITFTGPNNWKYSSKVEDKAALSKVKVGDKVDIVWTEAVMISLDSAK